MSADKKEFSHISGSIIRSLAFTRVAAAFQKLVGSQAQQLSNRQLASRSEKKLLRLYEVKGIHAQSSLRAKLQRLAVAAAALLLESSPGWNQQHSASNRLNELVACWTFIQPNAHRLLVLIKRESESEKG